MEILDESSLLQLQNIEGSLSAYTNSCILHCIVDVGKRSKIKGISVMTLGVIQLSTTALLRNSKNEKQPKLTSFGD